MMRIRQTPSSRRPHRVLKVTSLALWGIVASAGVAGAQLIAVKTTPIADGDQFSFFPASNLGFLGLSIAARDSVHDPFVNPAKGGRIAKSYYFGAPTFFSVSQHAGNGSTLPLGAVGRSGNVFGAAALAVQSISDADRGVPVLPPQVLATDGTTSFVSSSPAADDSHTNRYAYVMAGRSFPASKLSMGASALWSGLHGIDGVPLLYGSSRGVGQAGNASDVRLGVLKEWNGGQSLEALLLHHRFDMSQRVAYADQYWDALQRQVIEKPRLELERERTHVLGVHLQYERPLFKSGWRLGAIFTANRLDQPSTPRYEIASIPSDRGRSTAFDLGVGLARSHHGTTVAFDAIYEPIRSHLLALADTATTTVSGTTIHAGDAAIDNRLRFSNGILRAGLSHEFELEKDALALRLQVGVQARSIYYTLDQHDLVSGATRGGTESWTEWTRGWGWVLHLPAFELHYFGRLTTGASRPGVPRSGGIIALESPPRPDVAFPFPGPPPQSTTMTRVSVITQQLSFSLPIR